MTTSDRPPPSSPSPGELHALRRDDGARLNSSKRIRLTPASPGVATQSADLDGWVLNLSRGGVRLILEEKVAVAQLFLVRVGDEGDADGFVRPGRVVWVKEEPDGVVAGVEFTDRQSSSNLLAAAPVAKSSPPKAD